MSQTKPFLLVRSNTVLFFIVSFLQIIILGYFSTASAAPPEWMKVQHEITYSPTFLLANPDINKDNLELRGFTQTLGDIGHKDGVVFEGAESAHEIIFNFPIPRDTPLEKANISLKYRVSPLLHDLANLQLSVNGFPLEQVRLTSQGIDQLLLADIPKRFLRDGNLQVIIRAALPISDDRCLDSRINASNLHIESDSTFTLHYAGEIRSLRDAWTLMPNKVTMSIPDREFNAAEFNAAWELLDNLKRQGKEVELVNFPTPGHIVVAKHDELEQLLQQELVELDHVQSTTFSLSDDIKSSNMALVISPVRSIVAILDPEQTNALQMMNLPWRKLGMDSQYRTFPIDYADNRSGLSGVPPADNSLELKLSALGADTSTRYVRSNLNWNIVLDPFRIPAGTRPSHMFLNIIAPPPPGKPPFELYVYLNDIMIHATRLENGQTKQKISVPLPQNYQEPYNRIQIQIKNTLPEGDCRADLAAFPVQILPDSTIIVERDLSLPKYFSELPVYLANDFDVYLPDTYLQTPLTALPYISALTTRLPVPFKTREATFAKTGELLSPNKPFIAIGDLSLDTLESPVKFDKGEVQIVDRNNKPLLKVDELTDITVAQLVTSKQQTGLWLRSTNQDSFPDVQKLFLNHDDVAFADHSGVLFSINSKQPTLASAYYPEARDWLALLGKYRFWFFVLGWLALTLIAVYLFRRARHHRDQDHS